MTEKAQTGSMPDGEKITDATRVARLLERMAKTHALLTVEIPGHPEHYTSSIVGIDSPYVLLDELLPSSGHKALLAVRKLQVTGKLDGIDIRFITTLDRADERNNEITYHADLPAQLEYRQRRLDHRAHIPLSMALCVITDSRDGTVNEGVLHDLSRGGAGIIFSGSEPAVEPGLLHECAIELPGDEWLYCAVELRYMKNITSRDQQLVGARFRGLSSAQERLVGQCINKLERESIRKRGMV